MGFNIPPETQAQLDEVASLLLNIYHTLAEMRYLDPSHILPGPHPTDTILPAWHAVGLDDTIIYLFSVLPYISARDADFLHGGQFVNYLSSEGLGRIFDPFYANPMGTDFNAAGGPYIRPWMTPLSLLGNHGSVIVYDAREHRIWLIDQETWGSTDLALHHLPRNVDGIVTKNKMSLDRVPSRPARDVLVDISNWYRSLRIIPGSGDLSHEEWALSAEVLRDLYRQHGWPDNFDGDRFEVAQLRTYCADHARYQAEVPLRDFEGYRSWLPLGAQALQEAQRKVHDATGSDKWVAQYELRKAEEIRDRIARHFQAAKKEADRLCPGGVCQRQEDLPLWECEEVRCKLKSTRESVELCKTWADQSKDNPKRHAQFLDDLRKAKKRVFRYEQAFKESTADAERLCPGKTFQSATGRKTLGQVDTVTSIQQHEESIVELEARLVDLREWAKQVPADVQAVQEMIRQDMEELENQINSQKEVKKSYEDWLEKHGNTD